MERTLGFGWLDNALPIALGRAVWEDQDNVVDEGRGLEVWAAGASAIRLPQLSRSWPLEAVDPRPRTKRSKLFRVESVSVAMKASEALEELPVPFWNPPESPPEDSSLSFLVCSRSILEERLLIRAMNCSNWRRLRRGPRLKLQMTGRTSKATKSVSATLPTCWNTPNAAIITAGSFVLIAFRDGTSFSWIVYLSKMDDLVGCGLPFGTIPVRSSSATSSSSLEPPQRTVNASKQLTLMPRLFVRLKVAAIGGNTSVFTVLKSRVGRKMGKHLMAVSARE